jgi:hypothetical protein
MYSASRSLFVGRYGDGEVKTRGDAFLAAGEISCVVSCQLIERYTRDTGCKYKV